MLVEVGAVGREVGGIVDVGFDHGQDEVQWGDACAGVDVACFVDNRVEVVVVDAPRSVVGADALFGFASAVDGVDAVDAPAGLAARFLPSV